MTSTSVGLLLIVFCASVEAFSQICFKMQALHPDAKLRWVSLGIALFALQAIFYTGAIQVLDIDTAYPMSSLCSVMILFLSVRLLKERMTGYRWVGTMLILGGCVLMAL